MIEQKVQIRFAKGEPIRFISHHDMMRLMQRASRRAQLPVRMTEGFNPRPRIVFPQALEVGIESLDEVAELELTCWVPPRLIERRLRAIMPEGVEIRSVELMAPARKGRAAIEATYEMHLAGVAVSRADLESFLQRATVPYRRVRRNQDKQVDLRPAVLEMELAGDDRVTLRLALNRGANARPREILEVLSGRPARELACVRIVKTRMRLVASRSPAGRN